MRTLFNKTIVVWKLEKELSSANIPHHGISIFPPNLIEVLLVDENQSAQAQVVIDAHDGIDTSLLRAMAAKTIAKNIPNWATWSQQNWATWQAANVSATQINAVASLADAKVILNKMSVVLDNLAKMEIALRDQIWSDIPDSN